MQGTNPKSRPRLSGPAVAALFLISGLAGIVSAPEADAYALPDAAGPGSFAMIRQAGGAYPDGQTHVQKLAIRNAQSLDEELSIYQVVVSINGTPASTGVTFDMANTEITNLDDWTIATTNECDGPDVNLAGMPACYGLVFSAPKDRPLPPAALLEMEVGLILDAANPDLVECNYLTSPTEGSAPKLGVLALFEKDDPAVPGYNPMVADPTQPRHWYTVVVDNPTVDPAPIEAFSYYKDEDHNGHIDHVYIQFNKELDPHTMEVARFDVGRTTPIDEYQVLEADVIDPIDHNGDPRPPPAGEYCPNNSMVKLKFEEEGLYDTGPDSNGDMPRLKYRKPTIGSREDPHLKGALATRSLRIVPSSDTIHPLDRAQPVLVSAITKLDEEEPRNNNRFRIDFSEGVGLAETCDVEDPQPLLYGLDNWTLKINNDSLEAIPKTTPPTRFWFDLVDEGNTTPAHQPGQSFLVFTLFNQYHPQAGTNGASAPPWGQSRYAPLDWPNLEYRFEPDGPSNVIELNPIPHRFRIESGTYSGPDVAKAGTVTCDVKGNPIYTPEDTRDDPFEPLAAPTIVSVDGNIGFDKLTVHFNTAVNFTEKKPTSDMLKEVFDVARGREDSPTGVIGVEFVQGSDRAIVHLNGNLTPADVSGEPTYLRIKGGVFFAANTDWGIKGYKGWDFRVQEEEMVDVTPPSILHAITRDLDSNGEIDTYEVLFSEIIFDTSFAEGNPGQEGVILNVRDHFKYDRVDRGKQDDNQMYVRIEPIDGEGFATHRAPQVTGTQQLIGAQWKGFIMDQALNPDLGTGNWMLNFTQEDVHEKDGAPPVLMRAQSIDLDEDGRLDHYRLTFSEPVKDSTFDPTHWYVGPDNMYNVTGVRLDPELDRFSNDHILLIGFDPLDEVPDYPVGDTGAPPPELQYFPLPGQGLEDLAELPASLGGPNRMLEFGTDKVVEEDNARPVLMAVLGCPPDPSKPGEPNNLLQVFFSEGVLVRDKPDSPPRGLDQPDLFFRNGNGNDTGLTGVVLDQAEHKSGDRILFLTGTAPAGISDTDFGADAFSVREHPSAPQEDRYGIVQEKLSTVYGEKKEILYADHLREVTLGPARDIYPPAKIDDLAAMAAQTTAASVEMQWTIPEDRGCLDKGVTDYDIRYSNETPISPAGFDTAPQVPPEFIQFRYYNTLRQRNVTGTAEQLYEDENRIANTTLQVLVSGLLPDTEYYFAMKPIDRAGNKGPMSDLIKVKTDIDLTPPEKPEDFSLSSPTHPEKKPVQDPFPAFEWTAALDPESVHLFYRYALSTSSTYEADPQTDPAVFEQLNVSFDAKSVAEFTSGSRHGLAPEHWYEDAKVWYFHLSACSGGGCTPLGKYEIRIDPPINRTEMRDANQEVEYEVVYDEETGKVTVSWELPPKGGKVPCTANGVQVWRRDAGASKYEHAGTFGENDNTFKQSKWTDPDPNGTATKNTVYLVTMRCPDEADTFFDPATGATVGFLREGAGLFPTSGKNAYVPPKADYEGQSAEFKEAPFRIPVWVWVVLGVLALLVITGIVLFFVLRRGGETELWEEGELDETEMHGFGEEGEVVEEESSGAVAGGAYRPPNASSEPAAEGGKTHDIKCPKCATQFQATGDFPLKIACPNCGASGTLK